MEGLRPLGVGELLDAAIRIYRSRAKTLLIAISIPLVPVLVLSALISFSTQPDLGVDPTTGAARLDGGDLALQLVGFLVTIVMSVVGGAIATAAAFRSISGAYVGDDPTWQESLRFARTRFLSVLGLTTLTLLATLAFLVLCIVPVVIPLAFLAVPVPALLVEGLGIGPAMSRSWNLVRGTFWRVLGVVLLGTIIAGAVQAALSAPLLVIVFVDVPSWLELVITALVTSVSTILVTPFSAALTMALYVDLRVRKEGFDLVLWAQRVGAQPTHGFPAQPGAPSFAPGWPPGSYGPGPGYGPPPAGYGPPPAGYGPPPAGYGPPPPPPPPPPPAPPSTPTGWAPPPDDASS